MGRGERDAVQDGSTKAGQKAGEVINDISNTFSGLFQRGRKKVEEQVGNIDSDQLKEQAGRLGDAIQGRAKQEIDGVRRDVEQAQNGNPDALIKRGIQTGINTGTFGMGGVAGEAAKRFGLTGKIGNFLERRVEEATRLDTQGFAKDMNEMFTRVDANQNGFMELAEIETARKDKVFWAQHAFSLKYLAEKYDTLQKLNKDEWFSENNGVSRGDVDALAKAASDGTGFGAAIGTAAGRTWENTWQAGLAGGAAGVGFAFLKGAANSGKVGLIVGGVVLAGGLLHDAADYCFSRRGKLETTIKDLG
ncbi:MAG: hypothetical protein C0507_13800 [Cyanobacteria bacterium PR.3.49]|nr:hypothetical protein [Cyanobacteria bacterium PR.3.49]